MEGIKNEPTSEELKEKEIDDHIESLSSYEADVAKQHVSELANLLTSDVRDISSRGEKGGGQEFFLKQTDDVIKNEISRLRSIQGKLEKKLSDSK